MNAHNDGGPAFPNAIADPTNDWYMSTFGMTLRDYFAAKAMQAFLHGAVLPPGFDAKEQLAFVGYRSYEMADAMLAARGGA